MKDRSAPSPTVIARDRESNMRTKCFHQAHDGEQGFGKVCSERRFGRINRYQTTLGRLAALQPHVTYVMVTDRHFLGGGSDRSCCRMLERTVFRGSGLGSRRQWTLFWTKLVVASSSKLHVCTRRTGPNRRIACSGRSLLNNDKNDEASGCAVVSVARDNSKMSVMTDASQQLFITMFN